MRTINYFSNERQIKGALAANAIRACRSVKRLRKCYRMSLKQVRLMQDALGVNLDGCPERNEKQNWYAKGE